MAQKNGNKSAGTSAESENIILHLRPLRRTVPVVIRLRKALKVLLRSFGFRLITMHVPPEMLRDDQAANDPGASDPVECEGRKNR